ncbi:EF-hand domain-containing protein [Thalassotalea fonticola]|uniref:EF-hand domain-containing protein n=1 Tax=Thalassotalea fonticola TaxID=3065649 RepID=A0ABZ0GL11_9GAMM|nr:EF-hand domain-containing protein [Colwelliaceae bacterium S1-1]
MFNTKVIATAIITTALMSQSVYAKSEALAERKDKQAFQKIDHNKDGNVSIEEFSMQAKKGKTPSDKQIKKKKKLFKQIDGNKDKKITNGEFSSYQSKQRAKKASKKKKK